MKIIHICSIDKGGAFEAAYNLHLGLLDLNISSKILVLEKTQNDLREVYYFLEIRNFIQRIYDSFSYRLFEKRKLKLLKASPKSIFSLPSSAYDITSHSFVQDADIINLHWVSEFLDYTSFFSKIKQHTIWTLHDRNPFSGGWHFKIYEEKSFQKIDKSLLQIKIKALSGFNRLSIVCPSKWLLEASASSKLFGNFKHYQIHYGIDTDKFKPVEKSFARELLNLPSGKKIILFLAESLNDKRKGFKYLEQALKRVKVKNILLLVVGSNSFGDTRKNIVSLGYISNKETLSEVYSAADVFVIPSVEDNLPNTVLESLSCGTPVVGFKIGGIPDMIRHKENGYLVDQINSDDLENGIRYVLNNLLAFDRKVIREDCINRFSLKKQALSYIELYKNEVFESANQH